MRYPWFLLLLALALPACAPPVAGFTSSPRSRESLWCTSRQLPSGATSTTCRAR